MSKWLRVSFNVGIDDDVDEEATAKQFHEALLDTGLLMFPPGARIANVQVDRYGDA